VRNVEFAKIRGLKEIPLPQMLDFYPLEDEKNTKISRFFENLKRGRLTTTKCTKCDKLLWPPRVICPECLSDELDWVDLGSEGGLYAFTEMRLGAPLGFVQDTPFCLGLIEVNGLLISARIDDATYDKLTIGDKVHLKIVELDDGRVFYRFVPSR
jgi:uncharacterized OB-fold protein